MYIVIFIGLLAAGIISSALSSILFGLTQERINKLLNEDSPIASKLHRLKLNFEENIKLISLFEVLLYTIASLILGFYIMSDYENLRYLIYAFAGIFIGTALIRIIVSAIFRRFADDAVKFFLPVISLELLIMKPVGIAIDFIENKILGTDSDEASREEINALMESAREGGSIDDDEYRILTNMMRFSDVLVSDVMTPRTVMFSLEASLQVKDIINFPELRMYSRFPVWEGESIDEGIIGYVMSRDVLHAGLTGKGGRKLSSFIREVYFIPENAELDIALNEFLKRRQHLFVVVDEYGGVEGLITMEDVLETILGVEIVDEADKVVDLRVLAKQRRDKRIRELKEEQGK